MTRFKRHLFICENLRPDGHPRGSCGAKHGMRLAERLKEELRKRGLSSVFRANKSGCLDACEFGPVIVVYPDGVWYGHVSPDDVEEIIDEHIIGGTPVERLRIDDSRFQKSFDT